MSTIPTSNSVLRISRAARRAIIVRNAQNSMGRVLLWALGAALVVLLLDRLVLGWGIVPWWGLAVIAVVVAAGWSGIRATLHAPSMRHSAGVLDDQLHLRSRLRSAMELVESKDAASGGFVELAIRDAESLSQGLDGRSAQPEAQTQSWWWSMGLLLAVVAAGLWVPMRTIGAPTPKPQPPVRALAGIESAEEIARELEEEDRSETMREQLAELDSLRDELEQGVTDQSEADARTAAKLEELAQTMESESDAAQEDANRLSESIEAAQNRARAQDEQWDPRIDEFAESMREQRFDDAAEQIEALNDSLDEMTPAERERIAQQLDELADAIEPDAGRESNAQQADDQAQEPTMPDQADSPTDPSDSSDSSDTSDSSETSEQENSQEQSAQDSAEQSQEPRSVGDALREQAERVREPQPNSENQENQNQGEQGSESEQRESDPHSNPEQGTPQEPGQELGQEQSPQEQGQQEGQEQSQQQGSEQEVAEQGQDGEPTLTEPSEGQPANQEQGQEQGQEQPSQEPSQEPGQEPGQNPGQQPQQDPEQSPQGREQASPEGQQPSESLERRLRELDEQQRRARRDQRNAEQLREQAQRLMRPEDQPQDQSGEPGRVPNQPSQEPQGQGGGDGERDPGAQPAQNDPSESTFVPVDARDEEGAPGGKPVGKWYGPDGEPVEPGQSDQTAQRFRRATKEAQRAIDEQQVPRRYRHLVREVFQRVQDRADTIEGGGGSIAPQGQDAVPSKSSASESSSGG